MLSDTIVRDNVPVSLTGQRSSQVDVQVTALWADPGSDSTTPKAPVWFRIRALGTTPAPGADAAAMDRNDMGLHRMNIRSVRSTLQGDDNLQQGVPLPSVSRTIEVIARPIPRYPAALLSRGRLLLPKVGDWSINSYYRDAEGKPVLRTRFSGRADIGSAGRAADSMLVDAAWEKNLSFPRVNGNILLNGAVRGADHLPPRDDPWWGSYAVHDDFDRTLRPAERPQNLHEDVVAPSKEGPASFEAGTLDAPKLYVYTGDLGTFSIKKPASGDAGHVVIVVRGNLIPWTEEPGKELIAIDSGVKAEIYVEGPVIDLSKGPVNAGPEGNPLDLRIYGINEGGKVPDATGANDRVVMLNGAYNFNGILFAPYYNIVSQGPGEGRWDGAFVGNSIDLTAGAAKTCLFPEALLGDLESSGFEITRYFEDNRK